MGRCISFLRDEGTPQEQAVAICSDRWGKKWNMTPITEAQKKMFWKRFDRRRWTFTAWAQDRAKKALDAQISPVLEGLEEGVGAGLARVSNVSDDPILKLFEEIYGRVGGRFATASFRSLKSGYGPTEVKQEESEFVRFMQQWIRINGLQRIEMISENTRIHLRQALEKGIEDGMGIEEIARMISGSRRIAGLSRARVIARTEIISASNRGSLEGAKRTNLDLNKIWISTRDGRTRRLPDDRFDHFSIDGQTVPIDEPFEVQGLRGVEHLMFPGDPQGSPGNVIQCRCTQGYQKR